MESSRAGSRAPLDPLAPGRALRDQSAELAERLAAVEELVAATLTQQAMRHPDRATYLLAQSEEAR